MRVRPKQIRKSFARSIGLSSLHNQIGMAVFLLFACLILSLSLVSPFNTAIKETTLSVLSPIVAGATKPVYAMRDAVDAVTDLTNLRIENEALRLENEKLQKWYWAAQSLEAENARFEKLLNVTGQDDLSSYEVVTTQIMADTSNEFSKSLLLPIGRRDGIEKGQPVLSGHSLIGRVIDVKEDMARVMLLSDIGSKTPVLLSVDGQDVRAMMNGDNGLKTNLSYLPNDIDVTAGLPVVTSGHGAAFPAGLHIGITERVDGEDTVYVQMDYDLAKSYMVHVLKTDAHKYDF